MNESEPPSPVAAELMLSSNDRIVDFTSILSVDANQASGSVRFPRPKELVLTPLE